MKRAAGSLRSKGKHKDVLFTSLASVAPMPPPRLIRIRKRLLGGKHTVVDRFEVFTPSECEALTHEAEAIAMPWTDRNADISTYDHPLSRFERSTRVIVKERMKLMMQRLVVEAPEMIDHVPATSLIQDAPFIIKYDETTQKKLKRHRDGCALTLIVSLSKHDAYVGGGTRFFRTEKSIFGMTVRPPQGGCVAFCGNVWHEGAETKRGTRYILVQFFETPAALHKRDLTLVRQLLAEVRVCCGTTKAFKNAVAPLIAACAEEVEKEFIEDGEEKERDSTIQDNDDGGGHEHKGDDGEPVANTASRSVIHALAEEGKETLSVSETATWSIMLKALHRDFVTKLNREPTNAEWAKLLATVVAKSKTVCISHEQQQQQQQQQQKQQRRRHRSTS